MPRYIFCIRHGHQDEPEEVEVDLDGDAEARAMAVRAAGEALRDLGERFWADPDWRVQVVDAAGATLCDLRVSDILEPG